MRALGIDIGTTTISAVIADRKGQKVERSYTIANESFVQTGVVWEKIQDPEIILQKIYKLLDEIFEEYGDIRVIGLTGQMHGIVYLNGDGEHISPLYTWQDGRGNLALENGKSICKMLEEEFSVKASAGYGLVTHLYNLKRDLVPAEAAKVCTIMDYIGMRLTGRKTPLIHSSNAASLGLYDVEKSVFLKDIFEKAGGDAAILPEVTEDFICTGIYRGIPVSAAIGDNQASFLGSVEHGFDSVLVNMGTGGQISVLSEEYFTAKGIEARPFAEGYYLLAGSSLCGGRAYAALEHFFRMYAEAMGVRDADHYSVMEKILDHKEKTDKLKVNTAFSGTRENPEKRGSIKNIGTANFTPGALIEGVMVGMAEELYKKYGRMEKGLHLSRGKIIASGNGLRKNHHLQKTISEKFGMSLQMAEHEEESAFGAAVSGMIASGELTLEEAIGIRQNG